MAFNRIVEIDPQIFSGLSMLETLYLNNNRIIVLQRNVFASFEYLKKLTFNNNQIVLITHGSLLSYLKNLFSSTTMSQSYHNFSINKRYILNKINKGFFFKITNILFLILFPILYFLASSHLI